MQKNIWYQRDREEAFLAYAKALAAALYEDDPTYDAGSFHLCLGEVGRQTEGVNFGKTEIYFNVATVRRMGDIVADGTSLIVHELAHCRGAGHDGVYDREYERLANRAVVLALERPELFMTYRDGAEQCRLGFFRPQRAEKGFSRCADEDRQAVVLQLAQARDARHVLARRDDAS